MPVMPRPTRLFGCLAGASVLAALLGTAANADMRKAGTAGVMKAVPTAGAVRIRRIGVFDDSRTGLGRRLAEHIRKRLKRRGIRLDPTAPTLLVIRPNITNQRGGGPSATDEPLSVSPDGQARVSASPVWRHSTEQGISRVGKVPTNQLGGGRVSFHLRNKLKFLREAHSVYRIQLQLERDGQAPLWLGVAIAVGRSNDPERAMKQMIDHLLKRLGRPMRLQRFVTR